MNIFGQCFSIIGTQVYSDPPHYYRGNGFALGMSLLGIGVSLSLYLLLRRLNNLKQRNSDSDVAARQRNLGIEEMCDAHPDFFYQL